MRIIPEEQVAGLIDADQAYAAMHALFAATARGDARPFPVVREAIGHRDALFGFKSGYDRTHGLLGLKAGGYWPHNHEAGLGNHQSSVLLFDPDTGRLQAVVGGNRLTALRTAAACAVSIALLARPDARTLGIVGAGAQVPHHVRAARAVRPFERILMWNRTRERVADHAALGAVWAEREALCAEADVIVTLASSREPLIEDRWVRPGTHLACMGTDTRGKQEVEASLLRRARLFTDEIGQSRTIGEVQHAPDCTPRLLGEVILDPALGRAGGDEITLYDGTGTGLQDLAVAALVLARAGTAA